MWKNNKSFTIPLCQASLYNPLVGFIISMSFDGQVCVKQANSVGIENIKLNMQKPAVASAFEEIMLVALDLEFFFSLF